MHFQIARHYRALLFFSLLAVLGVTTATAQQASKPAGYPTRSIEFVVPFGVGGGVDALCRTLAPLIEKRLGVPVAVVNKPGGNSVLALNYVNGQPADGYTITGITNDILAAMAHGSTKLTVDDFTWLTRALPDIEMFFIRADDNRFSNFDEYVKYAKANPGKLSIAVAGAGGMEQIVSTLVNNAVGVSTKYIPYDVPTERYAALLGGHTDLLLKEPADMRQYLEEKKVKAIIQMIDQRPTEFADVPTSVEKGANVTIGLWRGVAVKAGTPAEISNYLYAVIKDAMNDPVYIEFKKKRGQIRPDYVETPEQFKANARKELEAIRSVLKK
jgi:tripartite-type tricarboxylate transporter receptor subunit TctC